LSIESQLADKLSLLQNLSRDQLIDFIKSKGNERKNKFFRLTEFQTRDATTSKDLVKELESEVRSREEALEEKRNALANYGSENVEIEEAISVLQADINRSRQDLAGKKSGIDALHKRYESLTHQITPEMIHRLNQIFENDVPQVLINVMESFIGLLRNVKKANNVDVELYLKSYEKLILKLGRIAPQEVGKDVLTHQKKAMSNYRSQLQSSSFSDYGVFADWTISFADYALQMHDITNVENFISEKESEVRVRAMRKERNQTLKSTLEGEGVVDFYRQQVDELHDRIRKVEEIADNDEHQSTTCQQTYHRFEKKYFEDVTKLIQGVVHEHRASTRSKSGTRFS